MTNSSDFSRPQTTDTYVNVTAEINAISNDLAKGLDPATTTPMNLPTNAIRWNSANGFWEKYTGTTWAALANLYNIAAATAAKLKAAVTIAISGDISGNASFDGSQNISITATLPTVNANPGTVGGATSIPVITTNTKGQVTAVTQAAVNVPVTSVFGRSGAVALASSDVTGALGYTPYDSASAATLAGQVTGKLNTSGGSVSGNLTMTGNAVIYSSQSGAADNARNTGYKMNDGQDIGEMNRSAQYYDDRTNNCSGYLPNGNCLGNALWTPANGNWWTWGLGFTPGNPGYDFAGGQTVSYQAVSVGFVYDAYYLLADEIGGAEYHRNYRNCNCGAFNCYTNCNCNCNCACSTDGGSSCFLADSTITMADGAVKKIQNVRVGEFVLGAFGEHNEIIARDNVTLGDRWMYKINNEHDTSDEHPHLSPDRHFYSANVSGIYKEWGGYFDCELADGSCERWQNIGLTKTKVKPLVAGIELLCTNGPRIVGSIERYRLAPDTRLYNFVVGGSHTYFVNGYCVTGWPREDDFDYQTWRPTGKILTIEDYRGTNGKKVHA